MWPDLPVVALLVRVIFEHLEDGEKSTQYQEVRIPMEMLLAKKLVSIKEDLPNTPMWSWKWDYDVDLVGMVALLKTDGESVAFNLARAIREGTPIAKAMAAPWKNARAMKGLIMLALWYGRPALMLTRKRRLVKS